MPIHVARFAIDDQTPYRDLYLSPLHCVFFAEALIPVMYLVNETSITQARLQRCLHLSTITWSLIRMK